jgi:cell wall-associated NlpC family hydrolase
MAFNGRAMIPIAIGSVFVWSGIKGWSILGTIGDLVSGVKPTQTEAVPLVNGANPGAVGPGGSSTGLAASAIAHVGHYYLYGGAPGKDGSQPWDCSSMVNYLASRENGLAIPGYGAGKYDGTSHGPTTTQWAIWDGLTHVSREQVQAGDVIVWATHMGIAVSNTQMVSALNPDQRTKQTVLDASIAPGPILVYGRYK